jgi:hypothetical protein
MSTRLAADNAVYMAPSGELQLNVRIDSETVWLSWRVPKNQPEGQPFTDFGVECAYPGGCR